MNRIKNNLELIPKIAYPYKLTYAFFLIFFNINDYKKIKETVLGLDKKSKYSKYYLFYLNFNFLFNQVKNIKAINKYFEFIFKIKLKNNFINTIEEILKVEDNLTKIIKLFFIIEKNRIEYAFYIYLLMNQIIISEYETLIILPYDIKETLSFTNDVNTLYYYLKGLFLSKRNKKRKNLISIIKNNYKKI